MSLSKEQAEIYYPFIEKCKQAGFTDKQSEIIADIYQLINTLSRAR